LWMSFVPMPARLNLLHACGQWHSSRVSTFLLVHTVNCVQTPKAVTEARASIAAAPRHGVRLRLQLLALVQNNDGLAKAAFTLHTAVPPGPKRKALHAGSVFRLSFGGGREGRGGGGRGGGGRNGSSGGCSGGGGGDSKRARTSGRDYHPAGDAEGDGRVGSSCLAAVCGEWGSDCGQIGTKLVVWLPMSAHVTALLGTVPEHAHAADGDNAGPMCEAASVGTVHGARLCTIDSVGRHIAWCPLCTMDSATASS
jgi:hypothetical protein